MIVRIVTVVIVRIVIVRIVTVVIVRIVTSGMWIFTDICK